MVMSRQVVDNRVACLRSFSAAIKISAALFRSDCDSMGPLPPRCDNINCMGIGLCADLINCSGRRPGCCGSSKTGLFHGREDVTPMEQPVEILPSQRFAARPFVLVTAAMTGVLLVAALALWAHYGSAVFYEMILAGIATC